MATVAVGLTLFFRAKLREETRDPWLTPVPLERWREFPQAQECTYAFVVPGFREEALSLLEARSCVEMDFEEAMQVISWRPSEKERAYLVRALVCENVGTGGLSVVQFDDGGLLVHFGYLAHSWLPTEREPIVVFTNHAVSEVWIHVSSAK